MEPFYDFEYPFIGWDDSEIAKKSWTELFAFNEEKIKDLSRCVVRNTQFRCRNSATIASLLLETLDRARNEPQDSNRPRHTIPYPNSSSEWLQSTTFRKGQVPLTSKEMGPRIQSLNCEQLEVKDKNRSITVTNICRVIIAPLGTKCLIPCHTSFDILGLLLSNLAFVRSESKKDHTKATPSTSDCLHFTRTGAQSYATRKMRNHAWSQSFGLSGMSSWVPVCLHFPVFHVSKRSC